MIKLAIVVGFLAVFGYIAWALVIKITNSESYKDNEKRKKKKEKKKAKALAEMKLEKKDENK